MKRCRGGRAHEWVEFGVWNDGSKAYKCHHCGEERVVDLETRVNEKEVEMKKFWILKKAPVNGTVLCGNEGIAYKSREKAEKVAKERATKNAGQWVVLEAVCFFEQEEPPIRHVILDSYAYNNSCENNTY
ncbi:MAG TPA: hypothetical protein ENI23_17380 [bacterium]|nr:hypothetical protein [bacterium]